VVVELASVPVVRDRGGGNIDGQDRQDGVVVELASVPVVRGGVGEEQT
jgi:hypothetical protein